MLTYFLDGPNRRKTHVYKRLYPNEPIYVARAPRLSWARPDPDSPWKTILPNIVQVEYRLVAAGPHLQVVSCRKKLWA